MRGQSIGESPFCELPAREADVWRPSIDVVGNQPAPEILQRAANLCGLRCSEISPSSLCAGAVLAGALVWAVVDDCDERWIVDLRERVGEEAFPLVLQTTIGKLDVVDAAFTAVPNCSIVIAPDEADTLATIASLLRSSQVSLHAPLDTVRDRQIESLQEEVQRISRMLARLAMEPETQREPPSPFIDDHVSAKARSYHAGPKSDYDGPTVSSRDVRQVIRQRRLRDELFDSELFADPAWDMLLDLYAARLDRSRVSVSSLCIAAAVPATTALRWIKTLTETGLFERRADQHDARRIFVQLSDEATAAMHRYFARLSDPRLAV
jgi:DNA-binding MarR family transcriptional regulator